MEGYALGTSYQKESKEAQRGKVQDALEAFVQEGARKMLAAALEEEVNGFLERLRYQRNKEFRGYRNGYHPPREVTVGLGPIKVRVPRVSEVPPEVAPQGFRSQIVKRYERASETTRRLFTRLYLEGLATGDFEPVFRELVGETTALSPNAIVRLKERWEKEYEAWRKRPLWGHRYAYVWADGVYLGVPDLRKKRQHSCVLWERGKMVKRS
jgi:transposase-like protein